jgi:hypothetical protein
MGDLGSNGASATTDTVSCPAVFSLRVAALSPSLGPELEHLCSLGQHVRPNRSPRGLFDPRRTKAAPNRHLFDFRGAKATSWGRRWQSWKSSRPHDRGDLRP